MPSMPKKLIKTVAEELAAKLNDSGQPLITIEYLDFYEICGRKEEDANATRFSNSLWEAVIAEGIIIGWGGNVVCITHDKPYTP